MILQSAIAGATIILTVGFFVFIIGSLFGSVFLYRMVKKNLMLRPGKEWMVIEKVLLAIGSILFSSLITMLLIYFFLSVILKGFSYD